MTQPAQGVSGVLAEDIRWRRPPSRSLIAAVGAAVMLGSLFLPWYALRLQIPDYRSLSAVAMIHINGGRRLCAPPGPECHETLRCGALVAGSWHWRSLIAVGAAVIILYVAFRAMQPESASRRLRDWQVVTVLATATALPALAAVVVDPVSVPATGARLGLDSALSYGAIVGPAGAVVAVIGGLMVWRGDYGSHYNKGRFCNVCPPALLGSGGNTAPRPYLGVP